MKEFIRHHNLAPRDKVTICRLDESTYFITPGDRAGSTHLFEKALPPVLYARKLADDYIASSTLSDRKERGQYFTPPEIASFMAHLATDGNSIPTTVLDPGAGTGILSCAVLEHVVERLGAKKIRVDAYENDPDLRDLLYKSFLHASNWARKRRTKFTFEIFDTDFLPSGLSGLRRRKYKPYDLIISNPPYSKISAKDPRAQFLSNVVYGQPNLYALFMAASIPFLKNHGLIVFITPRSYTAGHYFKAFRETFFSQMYPVRVHLFDSRKEVFSNQGVLQESIILKAIKGERRTHFVISSSRNASDLSCCHENRVPLSCALYRDNGHFVLRLPLDELDDLVIEIVDSWRDRLADYGLEISTGPVVPFRTKPFLSTGKSTANADLVPLLWMSNVRPMRTVWPCNGGQMRDAAQQFIRDFPLTRKAKLLLPAKTMVLLRRFSTKEQKRRLTASPLFQTQFKYPRIGIENHVNYIHRPTGPMSSDEARGLAALLNSALLDRYFRVCNGNTQVGAVELRHMPLPPLQVIAALGRQLPHDTSRCQLTDIDDRIWRTARSFTHKKHTLDELLNCDA